MFKRGNEMQTSTHGNGRGLNDLYILPDDSEESEKITDYLQKREIPYSWSFSDVAGQEWYGKRFIDIPFGESLLGVIEQAVKGN
jgi:hypothetical protein